MEKRKCYICGKIVLFAHNPIYFGHERMCNGYHPRCYARGVQKMIADSEKINSQNKPKTK